MEYEVLVETGTAPTGYGIVQRPGDGALRPISPCCDRFIDFNNQCEGCLEGYPGDGSITPVNNQWIWIDPNDPRHATVVHGWVQLILGCEVDFEVEWD